MTDQPTEKRKTRAKQPVTAEQQNVEYLPLTVLRYDCGNPRIVERLGGNPTQDQIRDLLLGGEINARELVPSFIENGYIPYEPMIVRQHGAAYTVIEGNRRLAALRSMVASDDPDVRAAVDTHGLERVPCLVFHGDDKQLLSYLGLRHISKTKDWSTSAKGAYVERILRAGYELKAAAKLTGTTQNALRLLLLTRRLFEEAASLGFSVSAAGGEGDVFFWHLGDAIRRTKTKAYIELAEDPDPLRTPAYNQTKLDRLVTWLYGKSAEAQPRLIQSIRDISRLDACLGSARAVEELEAGASLAEAEEAMQAAGDSIAQHLRRAELSVRRACSIPVDQLDGEGLRQAERALSLLDTAIRQLRALLDGRRTRAGGAEQDA